MMELVVHGDPVAKKRPRFVRQLPPGFRPLDVPVSIRITAWFKRPKHHFGTGRNAGRLKPSAPRAHCIRPDVDNIAKFVMDCLQPRIIADDKLVVSLVAEKHWGDDAGKTVISICKEVAENEHGGVVQGADRHQGADER